MAITFDPVNKRIILDSASTTATELYSRWVDWSATGDNLKYGMVFRQVGSDDLGGGLVIPPYYFLQNGWRVRPMEANHMLVISGNLFVDGGGQPVVNTLGPYNVSIQYTVAVQAQGFITNGSGATYTPQQIAEAVIAEMDTNSNIHTIVNEINAKVSALASGYDLSDITADLLAISKKIDDTQAFVLSL